MSLVCSISGQVPDEPVICPKGYVFEKRIIEKHLSQEATCPHSGEALTKDALLAVQANKVTTPRPAAAASLPGLLSLFTNEWDAVMAEQFQLKKDNDELRQQLAQTMYQHDAACRVVARLIRERDQARAQLAPLQHKLANATVSKSTADELAEEGITAEMIARIQEQAKVLAGGRKKRKNPDLTPLNQVQSFHQASSHPIHQSTAPGILCVDIHPTDDRRILTGGVDQQVNLFNVETNKLVCKLNGHTKKVTHVKFHNKSNVLLSGSADTTVRVWRGDESNWESSYKCSATFRKHEGEITALSLHPLGDFFLSAALDKSWSFNDTNTGRCIMRHSSLQDSIKCMKFHPDGVIMAGGCAKNVEVWDVKEQKVVATLEGHDKDVTSLSFSENGYYLATGSDDNCVKLWDLRKPVCFHTIQVNGNVKKVLFDKSSQYLSFASENTVSMYHFESRNVIVPTVNLEGHTDGVTDVAWGRDARYLASTSMDRTLKIWRPKA